jgi:Flp pilus assembly protein TadG
MTLRRMLRRFGASEKGIAAVEFAILAPMMIFLLFGSVELIEVLNTNKRAQNAAASLADVVARDTEVSTAEINALWSAIDVLMFPDDGATMEMRVTSIRIVDAATARVVWSEGRGMTARTANSVVTLPAGMMRPGTSVIMAESSYPYESPLGFVIDGTMDLEHVAYRRSRLVDPIPRVG